MNNPFQNEDIGKLILRLTLGGLILFHGVSKLVNPGSLEFIKDRLAGFGLPEDVDYGVYLGEVIGPLMIIFGIFSRIGGLLVAGNMLFAIALVHTGDLFDLNDHGGWALELQGFYLFSALAVLFLGSGNKAIRPD
jgi:putative oxidoreductase